MTPSKRWAALSTLTTSACCVGCGSINARIDSFLHKLDAPLHTKAWWLFWILVGFTGVFHWVFIFNSPSLGKRFWKRIDYVWLSMTAFGLFAAASGARNDYLSSSQRDLISLRLETRGQLTQVLRALVDSPVCQPGPLRTGRTALELEKVDTVCIWARHSLDVINDVGDNEVDRNVGVAQIVEVTQRLRPQEFTPVLGGVFNIVDSALSLYKETTDKLEALRRAQEKSDGQRNLEFVGLMLLPLGLALRFTKVTAELRLERDASLQATANAPTRSGPPEGSTAAGGPALGTASLTAPKGEPGDAATKTTDEDA